MEVNDTGDSIINEDLIDNSVEEVELPEEKNLMMQFIELYETLPELWNSSSSAYSNRTKRNNALDKLLVIFKKIKKEAKREDVRKKINTLRSNFRKELKKIEKSQRSGVGAEEVYVPTCWKYYALKFLQGTETPAVYHNDSPGDSAKVST